MKFQKEAIACNLRKEREFVEETDCECLNSKCKSSYRNYGGVISPKREMGEMCNFVKEKCAV